MTIALPPGLSQLVDRLVHTGRYADEGEVVREALRVLERQEFDESPAIEAALLEVFARLTTPTMPRFSHAYARTPPPRHESGHLHRPAGGAGHGPCNTAGISNKRTWMWPSATCSR